MTIETCDFCGIDIRAQMFNYPTKSTTRLVLSQKAPYDKEFVPLTVCCKCSSKFLNVIGKQSRKEWMDEAKTKLKGYITISKICK